LRGTIELTNDSNVHITDKSINSDDFIYSSKLLYVTESQHSTRRSRHKLQTRTQLINAARTQFARKGVDATRINEITELADVGFGSFYNHFASKDEIVAAVLEQEILEQGATLASLAETLEDPAEMVAVAHRYFSSLARSDPDTAWLLVRLEVSHRVFTQTLRAYAVEDIRRGIATGRFTVSDPVAVACANGGALLGVMVGILDGTLGDGAESVLAESVLRSLGVDADQAAEIARRPMPESVAATG
jgi:AcrR family transcriptional regulator